MNPLFTVQKIDHKLGAASTHTQQHRTLEKTVLTILGYAQHRWISML